MNIDILIFISCICMMFIMGRIFIVPIKLFFKLALNSVLGGILILIINIIGEVYSFHIGLNIYTSVLVRNFRGTWSCIINFTQINNMKKRRIIT